jgi:hypothetical protein
VGCKEHIKLLVNPSEVKNLVIHQTFELEDECEVPQISKGWLLQPVAIEKGLVSRIHCFSAFLLRMVERLGRCPCGYVERGVFFNKTGGEVVLQSIGFKILLGVPKQRLVFLSKISRWVALHGFL